MMAAQRPIHRPPLLVQRQLSPLPMPRETPFPRDNRAELGTDKILFARPDLTIVWRQARDYIARYKLLRLTQSTAEDGIHRQTICNLWRIERHADNSVHTYAFDLRQGLWHETEALEEQLLIMACR